ncbi:MAG TPA: long-chain fatty acid--CoA ligase [Sulfolobales archaeon]|nr:long-chain fatty acid--CoA ligase [Sulfolobales archaeon]
MFMLNIRHILERARLYFGKKEIISRTYDGYVRYTYMDMFDRVCRLINALESLRIGYGDRVASMAWNTHRHLELHFAVPAMGAVLHTVNLRYSPEEMIYTINKAGDRILFVDPDMIPTVKKILEKLETVESVVIMTSKDPEGLDFERPVYMYEELLERSSGGCRLRDVDENSPAVMCFTSGTTGFPKGVIYTHRGIFLRSLATCLADTYALSERDVILHIVPMFHISSWFMPYAATLVGAKQVFPGPRPKPEIIYDLIKREGVTVGDGAPTVWIDFLNYLRAHGEKSIEPLKRLIIGGSAPPKALIKSYWELGVEVYHAWGMTETYDSAAAFTRPKSYLENLSEEERLGLVAKQGLPFPGIEVMVVDEGGKPLPWDGKSVGELLIRGAWVVEEYYGDPEATKKSFLNGWLKTGDLATIDGEGYIEIVDRVKDVIKSGGEWISSVKVENEAMAHPAVLEAVAIAVPHPRWGERPLLIVKLRDGYAGKVSKEDILGFLRERLLKWWVPDDVVFVDEIPKTGTGKFDKKVLRERFRDYYRGSGL